MSTNPLYCFEQPETSTIGRMISAIDFLQIIREGKEIARFKHHRNTQASLSKDGKAYLYSYINYQNINYIVDLAGDFRGNCLPLKNMLYLKRSKDMSDALTCEKVLELIKETNRLSSERLEKDLRESQEKFEEKLDKSQEKIEEELKISRQEFEKKLEIGYQKRMQEFEEKLEKSRKEFDKKIGELTGTLGKFVEGLVKPKLLEMFRQRGVDVTDILHNVEIHDVKGQKETQIDLLLINAIYTIAVEVKTTLTVGAVKEHIKRLDRLQQHPKRYVKGTILLGAVAAMIIQGDADKYAYKKGLYVLKQKGEIVKIANDEKFKPREWVVP